MTATWNESLLAFASDLSGGDAVVTAGAQRHIASPPTTIEAIGFYGQGNAPPRVRTFLGVVSLLLEHQHIQAVEDKYTWELFGQWQREKRMDVYLLPAAGRGVFAPMVDVSFSEDPAEAQTYETFVWQNYAQATSELEQQISEGGRVLMSLDPTIAGDSLFFAFLQPDIARRWQDLAFIVHEGHQAGLRQPMWDRFWDHLMDSLGGMFAQGNGVGLPPGTRKRNPSLQIIG